MNKEALLNIILSDINEVETLLRSFQGSEEIPAAFMDLTERKLHHLVEEFSLLKTINQAVSNPAKKEEKITETEQKVIDTPTPAEEPTIVIEKQEPVIQEPVVIKEEKIVTTNNTEVAKPIVEEQKEDTTITSTKEVEINTIKQEEPVSNTVNEIKPTPLETPTPEIKIEEKKIEIKEESAKTLGESLGGEKKSVNDIIANNKESKLQQTLMGKPIQDLTKSLGLNDRFMFQRELFEGNADIMKQTLLQLNEMPDFNSAQSFISSNFNWDQEQEATQAFFNYVKRKFH